jgi:hypothetical protein
MEHGSLDMSDSLDLEFRDEQVRRVRQWLDETPDSYCEEPPFNSRKKSSLMGMSFLSSTSMGKESSIGLSEHESDLERLKAYGCFAGISNIFKCNKRM